MNSNDEYKQYLDTEAAELMQKITFAQIAEAVNYFADKSGLEEELADALREREYYYAGLSLSSICYEYWRECLDYKHSCDLKGENPFGDDCESRN